jgi:plasmid rolling circle replication initiator protein Rep
MLAGQVQQAFLSSANVKQVRRGERMAECGPYLIFKLLEDPDSKEIIHKLRYAEFCRVRLCPVCMWRKSMAWRARFHQAWQKIIAEYSSARYFHLVLTVPNCKISDLRFELDKISKAWNRMCSRKTWPALGFLKSVEITKDQKGFAHPHVHALMMVPPSYFSRNYMNRDQWREFWLSSLRIPLDSKCIHPFVRAVRGEEDLAKTVLEVSKYAVKPLSMEKILRYKSGKAWFLDLDMQLSGTKAVTLGGVLKDFFSEEMTDEELLLQDREVIGKFIRDVRYDWMRDEKHYMRTKVLSLIESAWWDRMEQKWMEKVTPSLPISVQKGDSFSAFH